MKKLPASIKRFTAVVITGGSSGIGESLLKTIYNIDHNILFCNLSRTVPSFNPPGLRLRHLECDLSDDEQLAVRAGELITILEREGGGGEILLINNSGIGSYGHFPTPGLDHQLYMLDLNVRAVVHLTGLLLPVLKERGGVIINISSTTAFFPTPYMGAYGAGKTFLLHWSLALDHELRGSGVRALAVCPGPTSTNFFRHAGFASEPDSAWYRQTADQVAEEALNALARGKSLVVCGWTNKLQTFAASKLPKALAAFLAGMFLKKLRLEKLPEQTET